jgi:hypothetical protein
MSTEVMNLLNFSIVIAAVIAFIRFWKIDLTYFPFILLVWVNAINQAIASYILKLSFYDATDSNIYSLIESMLILWFFKNLGLFNVKKKYFYFIFVVFIIWWIADNFGYAQLNEYGSYFTIFYSFVIVLMSISMLNRLIITEKGPLLTNAIFLICIGFIISFTFILLVEIFWRFGLNSSLEFRQHIYRIMSVINLFVNLIYALAILWMPTKQEYTLQ